MKRHINIIIMICAIGFFFVILLFGEFLCRAFTNITLFGNSRNLFIKNSYGTSIGNAKNVEALSFGVNVYTDENGFRVPRNFSSINNINAPSILILGDSVGFGPGVQEEQTAVGLLRSNFPSLRVYNSCVLGYNTEDYKNVVDNFLPHHDDIIKVYLIFCLNDVSSESAKLINEILAVPKENSKYPGDITDSLMKVSLLNRFNEFLRARSKLYLLIRGILINAQAQSWLADYHYYAEVDKAELVLKLQPIADIATTLRQRGVDFTVIISPYEFQVADSNVLTMLPNKKLGLFFKESSIKYVDAIAKFKNSEIAPKKLFLSYDPMHLSEKGHELIYEIMVNDLKGTNE